MKRRLHVTGGETDHFTSVNCKKGLGLNNGQNYWPHDQCTMEQQRGHKKGRKFSGLLIPASITGPYSIQMSELSDLFPDVQSPCTIKVLT